MTFTLFNAARCRRLAPLLPTTTDLAPRPALRRASRHVFVATASCVAALLASCGGGGDDVAPTTLQNSVDPMPALAAPVDLLDGSTVGTLRWANGDTAAGGQGQPIVGLNCGLMDETYHVHAHLAIYLNGERLAVPAMGIVPATDTRGECTYPLHTHDSSGKLHIEAPQPARFTLGQWFAIWGQPLSATQVADLAGLPIVVYVNDSGNVVRHGGDPSDIELVSQREITIQVGTPITVIPTYVWIND